MCLFTTIVEAQTNILIDFGDAGTTTTTAPETWNNITSSSGGIADLDDTSGSATGISITNTDDWFDSGPNGQTGLGLLGPAGFVWDDDATRDYLYLDKNSANTTAAYQFSGMGASDVLDITVFATRNGTGADRSTQYTINNESVTLDADGNTSSHTFRGITRDGSGNIDIDFLATAASDRYGYINLMEVNVRSGYVWTDSTGAPYNWDETTNWSAGATPDAAGAVVHFGDAIGSADRTVTQNADTTFIAGEVTFNADGAYTLDSSYTLQMDNSGSDALIGVYTANESGTNTNGHEIAAAVDLQDNLTVESYSQDDFTISGDIALNSNDLTFDGTSTTIVSGQLSGSGNVIKNGTGRLELTGDNSTLYHSSLYMEGNTWKWISNNYTVTSNTVIEFDYSSANQGEISGLGFDTDTNIDAGRSFKLWGTQNWGITTYNNYAASSPNTVHYTIPVGTHFTGSFDRLVFILDHDIGSPTATNFFSNLQIHEGGGGGFFDLSSTIGGGMSGQDSAPLSIVQTRTSFTLNDGTLALGHDNALGTADLTVNGGAIEAINGARTINSYMDVNSDFTINDGSALEWAGDINLNGATRTITVDNTSGTTFSGIINNGGITKEGSETLTLSGSNSNTYSGMTTVNAGDLTLNKSGSAVAIAGDLTLNGGSVTLAASEQIANSSSITLNGGTLNLDANDESANTLTLSANSTIDFGTGTADLTFADFIHSGGMLTVNNWSGTYTLTGTAGTTSTDDRLLFDEAALNARGINAGDYFSNVVFFNESSTQLGVQGRFVSSTSAGYLELVPVPEAGTLVSFALLLLAAVGYTCRKRKDC